jgi:hypothetical protein
MIIVRLEEGFLHRICYVQFTCEQITEEVIKDIIL